MISWENPWNASSSFFYRMRTLPSYLIWSLAGFISGWVQTRRLWSLSLGIPALAVAFLVIAMTLRSREQLSSETVRRYINTSRQHLQENRVEQAEFYINRLKSLGYQDDPLLVTRAEIAIQRDRPDLAEIYYREMLTNSDRGLDAKAHQQLARFELKDTPDPNSQPASEAIRHLKLALQLNPGDLPSHELLAKLWLARGDFNSAVLHLEPLAQANPAMQIELARLYEKLGRSSRKMESAVKAEAYFSGEVSKLEARSRAGELPETPSSQWLAGYMNWSESLIMQGRLDEASRIVTEALDRHNSVELRRRLASIYVRKVNTLPMTDESWQSRWDLITLSRNYEPDSRESLVILANIAAHAPFELRQLAQREIQPYLESGKAPPAAYYLVGTAAAEDKQWDSALRLLRKSVEMEPRADIAWNNLAHTLYSQPEPDWEDAQRCIDEAIRLNPTPVLYRETRGQIMVGMNRWAAAVQELELALHGLPPQARIHQGLAIAYRQLGDDDLADYHRTRQVALSQR